MMKKLFLIILLLSASFLHSQNVKRNIDLRVYVSKIPPRQLVTLSLLSRDTMEIGECSTDIENEMFWFSKNNWYKTPGDYKLCVIICDSYTLRTKTEYIKLSINENVSRIDAYINFYDDYGRKEKRPFAFDKRLYYISLDSVTLEDKWPPDSKGYAEYILRNNSPKNIYGDYFVENYISDVEKFESGAWSRYFHGGGFCGYYMFDVPVKPRDSVMTSEASFPIDLKPFEKGKYRFVVTYFIKDDAGERKDYILYKEFEIIGK